MANNKPDRSAVVQKKQSAVPGKEPAPASPQTAGQQPGGLLLEQAVEEPGQAQPQAVLALQQQYGNNEVRRVLDADTAQEPLLNRRGELSEYVSAEIQRARSAGSPMPQSLGRQTGSQLGGDFSGVRLHTDRTADRLAARLQARAFTIGNSIFFRRGAYAPHTSRGRFTLMHELTHVMQQSGRPSGSGPLRLGSAHDGFEKEADRIAADQSAGLASAQSVQGGVIQRENGSSTATVSQTPTPPKKQLPPLPPKPSALSATQPPLQQTQSNPPQTVQSTTTQPKALPPLPTAPKPVRGGNTPQQQPPAITALSSNTAISGVLPQAPRTQSQPVQQPPHPLPKEIQELGMSATSWNSLTEEKRNIIKAMMSGRKDVAQQLIYMATMGNWPKEGSGAEIKSADVIKSIPVKYAISLRNWGYVPDKYKTALFNLTAKPYVAQLGAMANDGTWPRDDTGNDIFDATALERIINLYHIPFNQWNPILNSLKILLASIPDPDTANAKELGAAAMASSWPYDRAFGRLLYADWLLVKQADASITPEKWNAFDGATRIAILDAPGLTERKKILRKMEFKKDKTQSGLEKAQKIFDNPILDALSGGAGTSSTIAQTFEKEDNSKVSSGIGVAAAGLDTAVQSMVLMGSLARLTRGARMARRSNASRAAKTLGGKEVREGIWGTASSALGLGGSISSMVSTSSKLHDPKADKESGLSERADKASGSFALATGALGVTRSGIGLFKGFQRSGAASKFVKQSPAPGDEATLSGIASFASKNQNRLGKGMEAAKNSFTAASGISNIVGGGGGTISSAVFGGLGLLTGIANAVMGKINQPKEADLDARTDELVELWKKPYQPAIDFAKQVLNINEPDLAAWVDEDPEAAKDLIKSKLSKY